MTSHAVRVEFEHGFWQMAQKAGSVVVFDGRMFHRACAHPSAHPRKMIYLVFHRDWYVDV